MADDQTWLNCGDKKSTTESRLLILPNSIYYMISTDYYLTYNIIQLCWTEETDVKCESSFFLVKMFDYFWVSTHSNTFGSQNFWQLISPLRPPVHLLCQHTFCSVTYISSDTKEENLFKKTQDKTKTRLGVLTKIARIFWPLCLKRRKLDSGGG